MNGKMPRITLYSTAGCAHCKRLRQWLQQRGVRFQEFDIQRNQRAFKAFSQLGARGVPVLMIGERRIDGFDPKRLDKLLP
jgi:glutaredoxin